MEHSGSSTSTFNLQNQNEGAINLCEDDDEQLLTNIRVFTHNAETEKAEEHISEDKASNMEAEGENEDGEDQPQKDKQQLSEWTDPEVTVWEELMTYLCLDKAPEDIQEDDLVDKEFVTMEQGETFYHLYSKILGFSIRKKIKRRNSEGECTIRSWVCSNEGYREEKYLHLEHRIREPRNITRTGCRASFRINRNKEDGTWFVKCFRTHHNHSLALSHQKPFLRSNRKLNEADREQAMLMKRSGIRTCHIWQYMIEQHGGWEKVGCIKPDLYRGVRQKYGAWNDCDTSTAMGYLESKKGPDPGFFCKHDTDEEGRLTNLFWADGACKVDYDLFGDCLSFDSTYKTNRYGKPLVVLLGSNNHDRTCVFGFALLQNELAETYAWILATFLECMDGKQPDTVLTDGCRAMNKALEQVMPGVVHRICSWHIIKNSMQHIHKAGFTQALKRLIFRYYSDNQWEEEWNKMKAEYELLDNDWLGAQYMTRHMWADSFLRGHYFGGSRATGRCESMNAFLKKDLEEDIPLWMFLRHCDKGLAALRYHEMREDYRTNMTEPLLSLTNMELLEEQASSIFTREIFHRVKGEIQRADKYIVLERTELPNYDVCLVTKYTRKDPKRKVLYSHDGDDVRCDCYWYETKGIPCRHIFSAMKHLNKVDFPECLVKRRWLKDAKIIDPSSIGVERKCPHPDVVENTRYGCISTQSNLVAFYATKSSEAFNMAMKVMTGLVIDLQKMAKGKADDPISRDENTATLGIKDAAIVPTKGRPTQSSQRGKRKSTTTIKPRYCKRCHGTGHDSRNCPTNGGGKKSKKN